MIKGVRLFFSGSLPVNPPISQALPADAAKCHSGALNIVHAEGGAGVVAEVELRHTALKVLLAYMVERANHTAL